jgi:hypothetical protein
MHEPVQLVLQHVPSMQLPEVHSRALLQPAPFDFGVTHEEPRHTAGDAQSALD